MDVTVVQGPINKQGYESLEGLTEGDTVEIKITKGGVPNIILLYEPNEGRSVTSGHIRFEVNEE